MTPPESRELRSVDLPATPMSASTESDNEEELPLPPVDVDPTPASPMAPFDSRNDTLVTDMLSPFSHFTSGSDEWMREVHLPPVVSDAGVCLRKFEFVLAYPGAVKVKAVNLSPGTADVLQITGFDEEVTGSVVAD